MIIKFVLNPSCLIVLRQSKCCQSWWPISLFSFFFYHCSIQAIPRTAAFEKVKSFRSTSLPLDQSAWTTRTSFLLWAWGSSRWPSCLDKQVQVALVRHRFHFDLLRRHTDDAFCTRIMCVRFGSRGLFELSMYETPTWLNLLLVKCFFL